MYTAKQQRKLVRTKNYINFIFGTFSFYGFINAIIIVKQSLINIIYVVLEFLGLSMTNRVFKQILTSLIEYVVIAT